MQKLRTIKISINAPFTKKEALNYTLDVNKYALYVDHLKIVLNENDQGEALVLNDVDEKFLKNKTYFIVGDSGVGKTTLVSHFNGLLKSKYGNIFIKDLKIIGKKKRISKFKKLRKSVGMVLQFPEYQLFKDTILKDVMFGPINLGDNKTKAKNLAKKYLNKMGIDDSLFSRSPFDLSGGQKRRVAIAGILAIEPDIIIFDEPTAGLDPVGIEEMLQLIADLKNEHKTIFVITHNMDHVLQLADYVVLLGEHQVLAFDEPYDFFQKDDLIQRTSIIKPKIIQTIDKLVNANNKFDVLYKIKPRTVEKLALEINKLIS